MRVLVIGGEHPVAAAYAQRLTRLGREVLVFTADVKIATVLRSLNIRVFVGDPCSPLDLSSALMIGTYSQEIKERASFDEIYLFPPEISPVDKVLWENQGIFKDKEEGALKSEGEEGGALEEEIIDGSSLSPWFEWRGIGGVMVSLLNKCFPSKKSLQSLQGGSSLEDEPLIKERLIEESLIKERLIKQRRRSNQDSKKYQDQSAQKLTWVRSLSLALGRGESEQGEGEQGEGEQERRPSIILSVSAIILRSPLEEHSSPEVQSFQPLTELTPLSVCSHLAPLREEIEDAERYLGASVVLYGDYYGPSPLPLKYWGKLNTHLCGIRHGHFTDLSDRPTTSSFVYIEDLVTGFILLSSRVISKRKPFTRLILGGDNLTYPALFELASEIHEKMTSQAQKHSSLSVSLSVSLRASLRARWRRHRAQIIKKIRGQRSNWEPKKISFTRRKKLKSYHLDVLRSPLKSKSATHRLSYEWRSCSVGLRELFIEIELE